MAPTSYIPPLHENAIRDGHWVMATMRVQPHSSMNTPLVKVDEPRPEPLQYCVLHRLECARITYQLVAILLFPCFQALTPLKSGT